MTYYIEHAPCGRSGRRFGLRNGEPFCWDQYLAMAFAQRTYRESLRDIEACLHSMQAFASARIERATLPRKPKWDNLPWQGKASAEKH